MNLTGVYCELLIGPGIPIPLPIAFSEVVHEIEIVHRDAGRSGFKIVFDAGRQKNGILDYTILQSPQLQVFNRARISVIFNGSLQSLMDGIITDIQLQDDDTPGSGKIVLMGQDISLMMDRKQVQVAHPAESEALIATKIIGQYANYQLVPEVVLPPSVDVPSPIDWVPRQYGTDYAYLKELAKRFGYVFYVAAGPIPGINTAYWGPPKRSILQPALIAGIGNSCNIQKISFQQHALAAATVSSIIQDRISNTNFPMQTLFSTRLPLSETAETNTNTQQLLLEEADGLNYSQAQARAQGITNRSRDRLVVAEGSLDTQRYGGILQARALVGVQGAGLTNDGSYYVEQVTHLLGKGYYHQNFVLTRDGVEPNTFAVRPANT
jgi:hypothetical protein